MSKIFYQKIREHIFQIPGENPGQMSLTGTNCFVVGSGATRVLIDACDLPEHNSQFLINFSKFLEDHPKVAIDKIFITHSHHDHIGGVEQVVGILKARKCETKIYKLMNANQFEQTFFSRYPHLRDIFMPLHEGQTFQIESNLSLKSLLTPGHCSDHTSFLLESPSESLLFSGDIILGTPSTLVDNLPDYMNSLQKLSQLKIDFICLPHSIDQQIGNIIVEGKRKLEEYVKYREERLEMVVKVVGERGGQGTGKEEIYEEVYGERKLQGNLVIAAKINLEQQLEYLVKKQVLKEISPDLYCLNNQNILGKL